MYRQSFTESKQIALSVAEALRAVSNVTALYLCLKENKSSCTRDAAQITLELKNIPDLYIHALNLPSSN